MCHRPCFATYSGYNNCANYIPDSHRYKAFRLCRRGFYYARAVLTFGLEDLYCQRLLTFFSKTKEAQCGFSLRMGPWNLKTSGVNS